MGKGRPERFSIVSQGAWRQFCLSLQLITVIPFLIFLQVFYFKMWRNGPESKICLFSSLAGATVLCILGYMMLSKYPKTLTRLKKYLGDMVEGVFPGRVALVRTESDIAVIEESLNEILKQLRREVEIVKTERDDIQRQFFHAKQLEAVGRFSGQVAAEFSDLFQNIESNVKCLSEELGSAFLLSGELSEVMRDASKAASMSERLMNFSRRKKLNHELFNAFLGEDE